MKVELVELETTYGKSCVLQFLEGECVACRVWGWCLSLDAAQEEYGSGNVCLACMESAFDRCRP